MLPALVLPKASVEIAPLGVKEKVFGGDVAAKEVATPKVALLAIPGNRSGLPVPQVTPAAALLVLGLIA